MAGDEDKVSKAEFAQYSKGINGDLDDIKVGLRDLTEKVDRRFDALDAKFEVERKDGHDAHVRIHGRIEATNKAVTKAREGHMSRATATVIAVLSSVCVGLLVAFITKL